jgi:hypothetical protein
MTELTVERLRDLLHYEVVTGRFYWKMWRGGSAKAGTIAGSIDTWGHRQIKIDGEVYGAHRLAWMWVTGETPPPLLDHVNGATDCNGFHNIRPATSAQNAFNSKAKSSSTSGIKGISKVRSGRWRWRVYVGRTLLTGTVDTAEEAAAAVQSAREKLHGEFARH